MALRQRVEGRSVSGTPRVRSEVAIATKPGTASSIVLLDTAGVEWYFWVDTTGALRKATSMPANPNTGGTLV